MLHVQHSNSVVFARLEDDSPRVGQDLLACVQKVTIVEYVNNSSKLVYFDNNKMTLRAFLKSYSIFKKYNRSFFVVFFLKIISHILTN